MDNSLYDYEKRRQEWIDLGLNFDNCTCIDCGRWRDCKFAFDVYNYDGDCLMEK
jgi:hypothetical protein